MNEVRHSNEHLEKVKPLAVSVLSGQGLFAWLVYDRYALEVVSVALSKAEAEQIYRLHFGGDEPYEDCIRKVPIETAFNGA